MRRNLLMWLCIVMAILSTAFLSLSLIGQMGWRIIIADVAYVAAWIILIVTVRNNDDSI